jgi:hypothetical protein
MNESWWQKVLLSRWVQCALPTLTVIYINRTFLSTELPVPHVPASSLLRDETRALLGRSEARLQSIEAKGPGLATTSAIIIGALVVALVSGWSESTMVGKVLLAAATWCGLLSLAMPIYLVGPLPRNTVDVTDLVAAAVSDAPTQQLMDVEVASYQANVRRAQRLANLQNASRSELIVALAVLATWAILGPGTGIARNDPHAKPPISLPATPAAVPTPKQPRPITLPSLMPAPDTGPPPTGHTAPTTQIPRQPAQASTR